MKLTNNFFKNVVAGSKLKLKKGMPKKILSYEEVMMDVENNRNRSWYRELFERNRNNLNDVALIYRGNKITYNEMFSKMREYAKALKSYGIKKGDEIPITMSNCPELVYILGGISLIGAKANIFGPGFDKEYITEIINGCNSNLIFVEDNYYPQLRKSIDKSKAQRIVMTSLQSSLPNGIDPYYELDSDFDIFRNKVDEYKMNNDSIIGVEDFINHGAKYNGSVEEISGLDDEFTITYSSGSTNSSRPKAIVHNVRSFITIGRYHDKEVSGSASMKNFTIQAHIPTHSNTDIISSISDSLMQGSKLALEPIYDKDFFIKSLMINKPNYVVATTSFWVNTMKKIFFDENYKGTKMPFLLIPFAVGEALSLGEEKFLNRGLRKVDAGKEKIPLPISPITMCTAGGDCEHGGIFWTLFRSLKSKIHNREEGLGYFNMVDVAVLNENGDRCKPNEYGRLVANSPCTMKKYKNNEEATNNFFITDSSGKKWADMNVYGYLDKHGKVFMKGRMGNNKSKLPPFVIADKIAKDTKNILSCEVVEIEDEIYGDLYVAHLEKMPTSHKEINAILQSANQRCINLLDNSLESRLFFRVHDFNESFDLTGCGKRNNKRLREEGLTEQCVKPVMTKDGLKLVTAREYLSSKQDYNKRKMLQRK